MADIVDRAQDVQELHDRLALDRLLGEIAAGRVLETADDCIDCGGMIPSERQAAVPGCQRCTPCASAAEMQARQFRKVA